MAEPLALKVLFEHKCGKRTSLYMCAQRRLQVNVRDNLSVDDYESFIFKKLSCVIQRTASAKYVRLLYVAELHTKTASIAQSRANALRPVMQIHHHFTHALPGQILRYIANQRATKKWYGRFRAISS